MYIHVGLCKYEAEDRTLPVIQRNIINTGQYDWLIGPGPVVQMAYPRQLALNPAGKKAEST